MLPAAAMYRAAVDKKRQKDLQLLPSKVTAWL